MIVNQIPLNNVIEDTILSFVNANTLKVQGTYYVINGTIFDNQTVQKLSNGYIQSITWDGTNYSVAVLIKYTQNNASWCDLGYVDVSNQYTNEAVTNAITIEGAS